MSDTLILIDGNACFYRAYYGIPKLSNKKGLPTNAVFGFAKMLFQLRPGTHFFAVAFDISKKNFRHRIYEKYKANRKSMPEDLLVQLPYIKRIVGNLGIKSYELAGYEADDILGTIVKKVNSNIKIKIYSRDKDLLQLVAENTELINYGSKEVVFDINAVKVNYKFSRRLFG
jgi:DNA polymerase-1